MKPLDVWRLWRFLDGGTEDTPLATLAPSAVAAPRQEKGSTGVITVRDLSEILIMGFGRDADNETFNATIFGMMDNGPLTKIVTLNCILGASSFAERPIDDPRVPTGTYFMVDTFTEAAADIAAIGTPGTASAGAGLIANVYRLQTLGFKHLKIELTDKDGVTGVEAMAAGIIWRPVTPIR